MTHSISRSIPVPAGSTLCGGLSDVYQDLFGEGSFTGKGIYDVDAFDRGAGRTGARQHAAQPRSVRGVFARAGLASDIEVVEDFPARHDVDAARQHRWARGDWQLLPWIFGRRQTVGGISRPSGAGR
jgi:cyclic beta-1,2-glucan synthetase